MSWLGFFCLFAFASWGWILLKLCMKQAQALSLFVNKYPTLTLVFDGLWLLKFKRLLSENCTCSIIQIYVEVNEKLLVLSVLVPLIILAILKVGPSPRAECWGRGGGLSKLKYENPALMVCGYQLVPGPCPDLQPSLVWLVPHRTHAQTSSTVPSGILGQVSARSWCQPLCPVEGLLTWYSLMGFLKHSTYL